MKGENELELLLRPISLGDFFREHWDQKPLQVPGPPNKFADVYDARAWARLAGATELKAALPDGRGWQLEIPFQPPQSLALLMAGMTVCADVTHDPVLAPFLRGFRRAFALPGDEAFAKVYVSNDGAGFAPHADKHHVFVMQMKGTKRWRISKRPLVASPAKGMRLAPGGDGLVWMDSPNLAPVLADDGSPVAAPDESSLVTVRLEQGHCLYIPPGTWHAAAAEGHSIALSLSPPRTTPAELFARVIEDILLRRREWRQDMLAPFDETPRQGEIPTVAATELRSRLGDLRAILDRLDPRLLDRVWRLNVAVGESNGGAPADAEEVTLRPEDVLVRRGDEPFHFIVATAALDGAEEIFFYPGGGEWSFPITARSFLTELSQHRQFSVGSALAWDPSLSFDDVAGILSSLVEAGVLDRRLPRATP